MPRERNYRVGEGPPAEPSANESARELSRLFAAAVGQFSVSSAYTYLGENEGYFNEDIFASRLTQGSTEHFKTKDARFYKHRD